jgi:LPXTG-motif cell wall-anchored protein
MGFIRGRRLPALLGVVMAVAFVAPAPATAAPADQVRLEADSVLVPTSSTTTGVAVRLRNDGNEDVLLRNLKVTIDASGLAGVATITGTYPDTGGECDTAAAVTTCTYDMIDVSIINAYPAVLDLKGAGAAAGTKGTYRVTAQADGMSLDATGTVTLAEGVNLVAGPEISLSGKPGSTVVLSPTVRNAGGTTVHGVVLSSSSGSTSASYKAQYSNCVYTDVEFYCEFDDELAPGKQYGIAQPISIALGKDAPAPSDFETYADWQTPDDAAEYDVAIRNRGGKPGTGPKLKLVEKVGTALRSAPQTDTSAVDNFSHVLTKVTGDNLPDLAAIETTVSGAAGATATAKVSMKNLGPARVDTWDTDFWPVAHVVVPAGTAVAEPDPNCEPIENKDGEFLCNAADLAVGETVTWGLKLKIGDGKPATGKITAQLTVIGSDKLAADHNPANDTADLLINPPSDNGGNGGNGGTGAGDGNASGGEGGSLPITGANAAWAGGAGVVLLLAGATAFVMARRRRTRYVA